jgi:murein tripeptide amidase MpaA
MTLAVSAAFDGGNIEVVSLRGPQEIELAIRKDARSDFYQWFYFRLTGAAGQPCAVRLINCAGSAYPEGWTGYNACVSEDREIWHRAHTDYLGGVLTIRVTPKANAIWIAYFAPYSMERHADLIARAGRSPLVTLHRLGSSLDGQDIDLVQIGTPGPEKRACWLIARQHPGETMAEWWMEGAIDRLIDPSDPVTRALLDRAVIYLVPNMNPDGSQRGHLRTNAAGVNLNREWHAPSLERSPEVYHVLARMAETGVDFCLDVHGDESLPYNFIAGFDGIPSLSERQSLLLDRYKSTLARLNLDFQTAVGYPVAKPGSANMAMSTNALAERFGCLAMTLEMPFKDTKNRPDPEFGWSPARSKHLAHSCLDVLADIVGDLR